MTPLHQLLTTQHDMLTYDNLVGGNTLIGLNVWLIHVTQSSINNSNSLPDLLKSTQLQLDSYVFGFYEGTRQLRNISIKKQKKIN